MRRRFTIASAAAALVFATAVSMPGCLPSPYAVGPAPDSLYSEFCFAWYLADARYSSFIVHPWVNWDQEFTMREEAALNLSSREELFDLLADLFSALGDQQVVICNGSRINPLVPPGNDLNFDEQVWLEYMAAWGVGVSETAGVYQKYGIASGFATPDSSIGYICIRSVSPLVMQEGYHFFITFFNETVKLRECRGMIVDLRECCGLWSFYEALQCSGRFVQEPFLALYTQYRQGPGRCDMEEPSPIWTFRQGSWQFTDPVLILTGEGTSGFGEVLALLLKPSDHVMLMGDRTAGSPDISSPCMLHWSLSYMDRWFLYLPGVVIYDPDMNPVSGAGIQPDIPVECYPSDFQAGVDPVLDAAVEYLSSR